MIVRLFRPIVWSVSGCSLPAVWQSCNCDFSVCCYCGITEQSITGGSFAFDFSGQTQPQCELTVGNKTARSVCMRVWVVL